MTRVFVIEDQATNMKLITGILARAGYEFDTATTADEGLPLIIDSVPDIILMDIHLPGTDGLTATRILKTKKETQNIPIVAITARAMEGDREMILEAGCDEYLSKPVRYQQLLDMLQSLSGEG